MWQMINALWHFHGLSILHRDIKPDNIQIRPDGSPVLIDFGAAREEVGRRSHSMTAIVAPGYSPLEQYSELGTHGPWTDIYALAATLYRVIGGGRPQEATQRALTDQMITAVEVGAGLYPEQMLRGIDWALKVRPEDRPQSLEEWSDFLGVEDDEKPLATPAPPDPRPADTAPPARPGALRSLVWLWATLAVAAIIVAVGGGAYFVLDFETRGDGIYLRAGAAAASCATSHPATA